MTRQYDNRGRDQINIEQVGGNVVFHQPRSSRSNAERLLLEEVDREVESRLAQSLHNAAFINLGKQSQPEQVKRIWDAEVKIGAKPPEPLLPEVSILEVFERSDIAGKLLILGDPGAGKTTTMLDLAQALIDKAKQDANDSIPVLINLSGWQEPRQSMPDWLVEELKSKYGVRKDIGKQWLQEKRLLPLLDGLDEVKPEHQAACVQAINQWLQSDSRPISVVVCSRREEYANSQTQLHLNGAILLQALTEEQIQDYLSRVNRTELWHVLQQDAVLLDLMKTPLLLSITVLSYEALSLQQWHQLPSTQQRLNLLLDAYIQTMLHRNLQDSTMLKRGWLSKSYRKRKPPTAAQTRHRLTFLAQQLQRKSQTEFLIERMQPDWLEDYPQKQIHYRLTLGLIVGLIFIIGSATVLFFAMLFWIFLDITKPENEIASSLLLNLRDYGESLIIPSIFGLCIGLATSLFFWIASLEQNQNILSITDKIVTVGTFGWSWERAKDGMREGRSFGRNLWWIFLLPFLIFLIFNLLSLILDLLTQPQYLVNSLKYLTGILYAIFIEIYELLWQSKNILELFIYIINILLKICFSIGFFYLNFYLIKFFFRESLGIFMGLILGLSNGFSGSEKETKIVPNQGIYKAMLNACVRGLLFGLVPGVIFDLFFFLFLLLAQTLEIKALANVTFAPYGSGYGMLCLVPSFGLSCGGWACIQHFALRLMLYRDRSIPWNYARFLNYCTERLLLQRVGGRYRFVHKLLQERFAELGK